MDAPLVTPPLLDADEAARLLRRHVSSVHRAARRTGIGRYVASRLVLTRDEVEALRPHIRSGPGQPPGPRKKKA